MGDLERRSQQSASPAVGGKPPSKDSAATPIDYIENILDEPTWESLGSQITKAAEKSSGRKIDARWASFIAPQSVKHSSSDGSYYRQKLAWCVGPKGFTFAEARQGGEMVGKQFHPQGEWQVRAEGRDVKDPSVKVLRKKAPAPPLPGTRGAAKETENANNPYGTNYGGKNGELWTNLPLIVREAIESAAPFLAGLSSEFAVARLDWNQNFARERIWFERRSATTLAGVYAIRERHDSSPADAASAQRSVLGLKWDFVVVQVAFDSGNRGELGGGSHQAIEGK